MDNLCHSLAGLCLGEAGLRRRAPLATATLLIGANLPDVDVLAYLDSPVTALWFRRGWTHGILAMAVWPLLLVALMKGVGWLVWRGDPAARPAWRGLLVVASIAVWSHPLLDLLNTYGVRLLMPFSDHWFYGDALFIVDPWVWAALLLGIVVARWRKSEAIARAALALSVTYMIVMAGLGVLGRNIARRDLAHDGLTAQAAMAGPEPLTPLRRATVLLLGDGYVAGTTSFLPLGHDWNSDIVPVNRPWLTRAAARADGAKYLAWARFPYAVLGPYDGCPPDNVCLRDLRYAGQGWAEVVIPLESR